MSNEEFTHNARRYPWHYFRYHPILVLLVGIDYKLRDWGLVKSPDRLRWYDAKLFGLVMGNPELTRGDRKHKSWT